MTVPGMSAPSPNITMNRNRAPSLLHRIPDATVSAMTCAISAASAQAARGRASCKRLADVELGATASEADIEQSVIIARLHCCRIRLPLTAAYGTARVERPFGPAISASMRAVACSISLACAS